MRARLYVVPTCACRRKSIVMAIYHFSAKVISRASGSSAVASAAYRSASRLYDQRLDRSHDFTNKSGVVHSEVMTPQGVPDELRDRESLWNTIEATEKRKDAQLAREIEFAIPREMSQAQGIELARDFVQREFVAKGMIADLNVHWDIGEDGRAKPHAHVMLAMRAVDENGFGAKVRDWNRTELLEHWREAWGTHVNERLAELGIEARIDHRTLEDQGIASAPAQDRPSAARMTGEGLEAERLEEHGQIARENGERIIQTPALHSANHAQPSDIHPPRLGDVRTPPFGRIGTVQRRDGSRARVAGACSARPDGRNEERFTRREMIAFKSAFTARPRSWPGSNGTVSVRQTESARWRTPRNADSSYRESSAPHSRM